MAAVVPAHEQVIVYTVKARRALIQAERCWVFGENIYTDIMR